MSVPAGLPTRGGTARPAHAHCCNALHGGGALVRLCGIDRRKQRRTTRGGALECVASLRHIAYVSPGRDTQCGVEPYILIQVQNSHIQSTKSCRLLCLQNSGVYKSGSGR